jgi:hypothetical protein
MTSELEQSEEQTSNSAVDLAKALENRLRMGQLAGVDENAGTAHVQEEMTWQVVDVSLHVANAA